MAQPIDGGPGGGGILIDGGDQSTLSYDDNGNLKTYNGWTYTYDAQNRLKVVQHGAAIVEQFWYDGLNRIITRNLNGNTTYHVYDAWNLIEEYAGPYSPPPPPPSPTPAPTPTPTPIPTPVAMPAYNPNGGLAASPTTVTITTATTGVSLRYTLDGTTPTESYGTLIAASSGTVSVTSTSGGTVLKTIAFKTGWSNSAVASATYTMPQVAQPTYNPNGGLAASPTTVTITTATTGASLRYTLDGTTPTESYGTLIAASSGTISVTSTSGGTVLKTVAFRSGWITSAVTSATYTMPQVAQPTYNPNGGAFPNSSSITVTITTATAGANMRYTLNGTEPTESYGTLIAASSGSISVIPTSAGTVLKAIAFKTGWITSAMQSATYSILLDSTPTPTPIQQVARPVFNPNGGAFPNSSPITVTITTATAGANLRYTLNGTQPTESYGTLIAASSGSISVIPASGGRVLKAVAFKTGWITSAMQSATYSISTDSRPQPEWTPPPPPCDGCDLGNPSANLMTDASMLAGGEMEIITETPAPVRFPSPDRIFPRPPVVKGGAATGSDYMLASYETGSNPGRTLSANAPSETTPGTDASASAPMNVYLYAGAENVSVGYYYFHDGRSNISHLTNSSNVLIERYTYDLNGTVSYFDGNGNPIASSSPAISNRFLFAGAILLPEANVYDMRNRMYFPRWGRFLQADPIGFKGDAVNLYRYCGNDPVNRTDPMGTIDSWSRLMLWQGGGDGTVSEQVANLERMQMQSQGFSMAQMSATERTKSEAGKLPQYSDWRDAADSRREETMNLVKGDRKEYGGELAQKNDNSKNFVATSPHPGPGVKKVNDGVEKGYRQTFSPDPARVPRGYHMTGFYYGHVYHDPRSFHYDAMRAQARGLDAVLFLPARTGAMSRRPISLYYDHNTEPPE